jgi:hypothetical protein
MVIWLVVWNIWTTFPYIGNVIIPTDELHHFAEGLVETTNQIIINHHEPYNITINIYITIINSILPTNSRAQPPTNGRSTTIFWISCSGDEALPGLAQRLAQPAQPQPQASWAVICTPHFYHVYGW